MKILWYSIHGYDECWLRSPDQGGKWVQRLKSLIKTSLETKLCSQNSTPNCEPGVRARERQVSWCLTPQIYALGEPCNDLKGRFVMDGCAPVKSFIFSSLCLRAARDFPCVLVIAIFTCLLVPHGPHILSNCSISWSDRSWGRHPHYSF